MITLSIGNLVANEKIDKAYTIARKIANEAIIEAGNAQDKANDQLDIVKRLVKPNSVIPDIAKPFSDALHDHEVYIWHLLDNKAKALAKRADKLDLLAHQLEPDDD